MPSFYGFHEEIEIYCNKIINNLQVPFILTRKKQLNHFTIYREREENIMYILKYSFISFGFG